MNNQRNSEYLECHHIQNQKSWAAEGVALNPVLRPDFDCTPNDERDPLEVGHWWGVPYIISRGYFQADDCYASYLARSKYWCVDPSKLDGEDEFNRRMEEDKADWLRAYPSGYIYEVRCLDGGAWDRSTWYASESSLEDAVNFVLNL